MTTANVFQLASSVDSLIDANSNEIAALEKRRIQPINFSREIMFSNMMNGEISLFENFPVSLKQQQESSFLNKAVRFGFPNVARARTQNGRAKTRRYLTIGQLMDKWEKGKGIVSVTDLHFRNTAFEKKVYAEALSDFNVYCHNKELIHFLEMMTMVVSTKGNVTETHSDDSDGTNHCFTGLKLWLVWDRLEGKKNGLQDVSHDDITDRAHFSIKDFLKTKGAKWFLVGKDQTLFLPGNYTHRVITLENYIGIGSFFVSLPAYIRSLYRWTMIAYTDVTPELLAIINNEVIKTVGFLKTASKTEQQIFGYHHLRLSIRQWNENRVPKQSEFMANPLVKNFINAVESSAVKRHVKTGSSA